MQEDYLVASKDEVISPQHYLLYYNEQVLQTFSFNFISTNK